VPTALDEVHVVRGAVAQIRVAVDGEQQAVGVADDGQLVSLDRGHLHALLDQWARASQRMALPLLACTGQLEQRRCGLAPARIDAGVARPQPRVGDRHADLRRAGALAAVVERAAVD
jgi:hypothetical protein